MSSTIVSFEWRHIRQTPNGIVVCTPVDFHDYITDEDDDIVSCFSTLENALEAKDKVAPHEKWQLVKITIEEITI